jgi:hypothetical protein
MKDILNKIASVKSTLDKYRPFPEHVVKQLRGYCRINQIIAKVWGVEVKDASLDNVKLKI